MDCQTARADRGAAMVEYALLVVLVAVVALTAVTIIGRSTADSYDVAVAAFDSPSDTPLTPDEKWQVAQDDYDEAIVSAQAEKASAIAAAGATYDAAVDSNKSLPKDERKAANAAAKADLDDAKASANSRYQAAVQSAKDAKADAKAEYKATK